MKNKSFGLDVGSTVMKAVWLSHEKEGYMLNATAAAQTVATGMLSDSPIDQEQIAQTIRKMVDEAKIDTKYVSIALPETQVYTKVIEMPILSDKELASAIYYEAEQYIPVPLDTITFDYKVLRRAENELKMWVLLVGAPAGFIQNTLQNEKF